MRVQQLFGAALLAVSSVPAVAGGFDFSNLTWNGVVNQGFLPSDGVPCTGGDLCSSNVNGGVLNGDLTFTSGGLTVHATAAYTSPNGAVGVAAAVQDHENAYNAANRIGAGLGVYHLSGDTSDDNITFGERLVLTFDQVVTVTSIGLRAEGHNDTGWINNATFLFNGVSTLLPKNVGSINNLNMTGTVFSFAYGGTNPDQFYLSSIVANPVPEPETYALMLGGLGALAAFARRRKALA